MAAEKSHYQFAIIFFILENNSLKAEVKTERKKSAKAKRGICMNIHCLV